MTKRFWKRGILILLSLLVLLGIGTYIYIKSTNIDLPVGKAGEEADLMAKKMMEALNVEAWNATDYVEWSFRGAHNYKWCKVENRCKVSWDETEVDLNLNDRTKSTITIDGVESSYEEELVSNAWNYFCNDSFWLIAPFKAFDDGVTRSVVESDGKKSLLVTYSSGGVTPGDSYLWHLDENGVPTSYQMWTSILPMKGLEVTWDSWITTESGAKISTMHDLGMAKLEMTGVVGTVGGCD